MKIAMFTDTYFPQVSGVATSIKILADELEKMGHDVTIFTCSDPHADVNESRKIIRIASIPFIFFTDRRVVIGGMNKAYQIAKEEKFDIVHTHTEFGLGLIGKYVAYRLKIPNVHTYHTMYEKYLHYIANGHIVKPTHVKALSMYFCNSTAGVIAPGKQMHDILQSYTIQSPIKIIPTGVIIPEIDKTKRTVLRQQLNLSETDIVLLSLSRLAKEKSLDKIVSAFPNVLRAYPTAKLVFVGDGPARKELEKQVNELNLKQQVVFVGEVSNEHVSDYYQMADMYVNASTTETQGLTYLEALVNGLPVIAHKNDYLKNIITNKKLGVLYEEVDALSDTIIDYISCLNDQVTIKQEDWKNLLYHISSEKFVKDVLAFYEETITIYKKQKSNIRNPKSSILNRAYFSKWKQ